MSRENTPEQRSGVCTICGSDEPFHVHNQGQRIADYFTIGRGQTEFQAAQAWQERALTAQRYIEALEAAIDDALRTTWTEDDEGGWGDDEDTLYTSRTEALAALQPCWQAWGDQGWHAAGVAEARRHQGTRS